VLSSINSSAISQSQNLLLRNLQALASGKQINSAADNPAAMAMLDSMTSQLNAQEQAGGNINSGLAVADTASGGLNQASDTLQQMRDLALAAGDASLNASDRQSLQDQMNGLSQSLSDLANSTSLNGQNLLDGSYSGTIQSGPNSTDTQTLSLDSVSSSALGVDNLDLSNNSNVGNALSAIDNALSSVAGQQSSIGGFSAGLHSSLSNQTGSYQQLATAAGALQNANYAQAAAGLSQAQIQNEAAIYVQNSTQSLKNANILNLLA
jgi:flagellin